MPMSNRDDAPERPDGLPEYVRLTSDGPKGPVGGSVYVRALEPLKEIQGHGYRPGREPLNDIDPDFAFDPRNGDGMSTTSDKIVEHWQAPKVCERCGKLAKPPGVTKGQTFDGLLCRTCSDPVLASFMAIPRGRPSKAHQELMAADAEKRAAQ